MSDNHEQTPTTLQSPLLSELRPEFYTICPICAEVILLDEITEIGEEIECSLCMATFTLTD